jgi:hypothetical protein
MSEPIFRASSIGKIMTEPRAKSEVLSVGAKTCIRDMASQAIFGVDFEFSSRECEKGITVEQESIDLLNQVRGLALVKNAVRMTRDGLTGEADCLDFANDRVHDIKSCWSIKTFRAFAIDCEESLYEWQIRAYMALYDIAQAEVNYCLVDTPEHLIGYEPMQLHMVSHIPAHLRVTTIEFERDAEKEARIFEKIKHATDYYKEVVAEFDQSHQKLLVAA